MRSGQYRSRQRGTSYTLNSRYTELRPRGITGGAPLARHVSHVLGMSSRKQMPGINARRHIAAVADVKPGRNLTDRNTIGCPVGLLRPTINSYPSVPASLRRRQHQTFACRYSPSKQCFNGVSVAPAAAACMPVHKPLGLALAIPAAATGGLCDGGKQPTAALTQLLHSIFPMHPLTGGASGLLLTSKLELSGHLWVQLAQPVRRFDVRVAGRIEVGLIFCLQ